MRGEALAMRVDGREEGWICLPACRSVLGLRLRWGGEGGDDSFGCSELEENGESIHTEEVRFAGASWSCHVVPRAARLGLVGWLGWPWNSVVC